MMTFIIWISACWVWMGIGFVLLTFQSPKLDNGLESIARMAAWPWFLFKANK